MSDKPRFVFNENIITTGSMASSITSTSYDVSEVNNVAVQAVWSSGSTPVGTTTLEASLDDTNYTEITDSSLAVSGNSGSNFYNIQDPGYRYLRLKYNRTSGSGTLNVKISGKLF